MDIRDYRAIDVHAHYGSYLRAGNTDLQNEMATGDAETVVARARRARTDWTVVSPLLGLLPRGEADAAEGNREASRIIPQTDGLLQWVIIDPLRPETYEQAIDALPEAHCMGIKIHPEEHVYPISEHGDAIFSFAAEHRAFVLVHSGDPYSLPDDFLVFGERYPEATILLAHLGNGGGAGGDPTTQVRAIQASTQGNLYVDTSSARSIMPKLVEWAVEEIGADRILYGTDTPLYSAEMQRARIDHAEISEADKKLILRDNAVTLLDLPTSNQGQPAS